MPYVYAVTEARDRALQPPLYEVDRGRLAAVVADHATPEPTPDSLWRHEEIVESLMADGPVLPMRFGSTTDDVEDLLDRRHDALIAGLERVRGAVELGVRVVGAVGESPPASGTEYLRRRAAVVALRRRIHEPLAALSRAALELDRHGSVGAYLVDESAVERFHATVDELEVALGVTLACTGPWPPYSFPPS
jgi:hypothetical protein